MDYDVVIITSNNKIVDTVDWFVIVPTFRQTTLWISEKDYLDILKWQIK